MALVPTQSINGRGTRLLLVYFMLNKPMLIATKCIGDEASHSATMSDVKATTTVAQN